MFIEDDVPQRFNWFKRFQMRLVHVDAKEMEGCPQRDLDMVTTLFWVMVGVWLWQALIFTLTLHMVLSRDGAIRWELAAVGVLLATIILLYDSYGIMLPSWTAHGLEELKRGGIELEVPFTQKILNHLWLGLRLMAAVVTSIMVTLFCSLQVFDRDITEENLRFAREQNKEVVATAENRFSTVLADLDADRARLAQNRDALLAEEQQLLRRANGEESDTDPEIRPLLESIKRLEQEKSEAEGALRQAEDRAANELGGTRTAETTGIAGNGPRAQAARQRIQVARRVLDAKSQELNKLRGRLSALRDERHKESLGAGDAIKEHLAGVRTAKEDVEARLKENTEQRAALLRDHTRTVNTEVAADPLRVDAVTGFLGKVKALWRLSADPVIGFVTMLFDIFFLAIEMAAVVSKLATFVPSTYATRLARKEHYRAALEAHMLVRDLRQLSDEYEEPHATLNLGEPPKVEGKDASSQADEDTGGSKTVSPNSPALPPETPQEPKGPDIGKIVDIFKNGLTGDGPPKPESGKPSNGQMPLPGMGIRRKRGRPPGTRNRPRAPDAPPG